MSLNAAVTLACCPGELLRARPPEVGLVRLENVTPRNVAPWRVVRLGSLRAHVEEWCRARGVEPPEVLPW